MIKRVVSYLCFQFSISDWSSTTIETLSDELQVLDVINEYMVFWCMKNSSFEYKNSVAAPLM